MHAKEKNDRLPIPFRPTRPNLDRWGRHDVFAPEWERRREANNANTLAIAFDVDVVHDEDEAEAVVLPFTRTMPK